MLCVALEVRVVDPECVTLEVGLAEKEEEPQAVSEVLGV